jgi:hypothetical protein
MIRELKCPVETFNNIWDGRQDFDTCDDYSEHVIGDFLLFQEYDSIKFSFTGREMLRRIVRVDRLLPPDYSIKAGIITLGYASV